MEVEAPPEPALRQPMMERAAQALKSTQPPMPEGLVLQMLLMIGDGHLVFIEPDIFALTTTGILLGSAADMPQA